MNCYILTFKITSKGKLDDPKGLAEYIKEKIIDTVNNHYWLKKERFDFEVSMKFESHIDTY